MTGQRISINGTMRTGSSLVSNMLSSHSRIMVFSEFVHFFRFIYKRYDPLNENTVRKMLLHLKARLLHRNNVEFDADGVMAGIKGKECTYREIYDAIMQYYLRQTGKEIWGDDAALEWRRIPDFLRFFPRGKVIHIYRDPRAVMCSWKRLSGLPNSGYLNSIFNGIDCLNYVDRFSRTLPPESYFALKYEDLASEPGVWVKKLCAFLEIEFEPVMLEPERWKALVPDRFIALGRSSYEGPVRGFSLERAVRWKSAIEKWELCFVESIAGDILTRHGYELIGNGFTGRDFALGLEKIKGNDFLLKQFCAYVATGRGTDKYPTDPTDYRNWGIPGERDKWFKDLPKAEKYLKEINLIDKEFTLDSKK